MKIVITDGYTLNPGDLSWDGIREFGEVIYHDRTAPEETAERIREADIVLVNKVRLTREVLTGARHLKYISVLATGYDCVDLAAARELGITVSNIPTYGTDTVAQFTLALILELAHQIGKHSESVKAGDWIRSSDFTYTLSPQIELKGKTLGILGYGRIGRRTAELARCFGMEVQTLKRDGRDFGIPAVSLEELFRTSDFLTLHCPLTPETRGIINRDNLARMKPSAFLINTARGPLVVAEDLRQALDEGIIAGAALDVTQVEPMSEGDVLRKARNIIFTPHIAWSAREARQRIMDETIENIRSFLAGKAQNQVS